MYYRTMNPCVVRFPNANCKNKMTLKGSDQMYQQQALKIVKYNKEKT